MPIWISTWKVFYFRFEKLAVTSSRGMAALNRKLFTFLDCFIKKLLQNTLMRKPRFWFDDELLF